MKRLTIAECRAMIEGGDKLSDADIQRMRDQMYALAAVALDLWNHLDTINPQETPPPGIGQEDHEKFLVELERHKTRRYGKF